MTKTLTNFIAFLVLIAVLVYSLIAIKIFSNGSKLVKQNFEKYLYKEVEGMAILVQDQENTADKNLLNSLKTINYLLFDNPFTLTKHIQQITVTDIDQTQENVATIYTWKFRNKPITNSVIKYFKTFSDANIAILQKFNDGFVVTYTDFAPFLSKKVHFYFPNNSDLAYYLNNKDFYIGKITLFGKRYKVGAVPIYINGKIQGAILLLLNNWFTSDFQTFFISKIYFRTGFAFILDESGVYILPPKLKNQNISNTPLFFKIFSERKPNQIVQIKYYVTTTNVRSPQIMYYVYLPDYGYYVGITYSSKEIKILLVRLKQALIAAVIISSLLVLLLLIILIFVINKGINTIQQRIHHLTLGELTEPIPLTETFSINLTKLVNQLIERNRKLYEITEAFKSENYDIDIRPASPNDIIFNNIIEIKQNLIKAKQTQLQIEKQEKIRSWRNQGLEKIIALLSFGGKDIKQWAFDILRTLVDYIGGFQGGFYILNEENNEKFFELLTCYAFNEEKIIHKKLPVYSGIFAKIYKDPKLLYIKNIPEEYYPINTVLGEVSPKSLILLPLIYQTELIGAIEIDFLTPEIEQFKLDFLDEISAHISSSITSWKISQETNKLLARYEKQAKELEEKEKSLEQKIKELQKLSIDYQNIKSELKTFAHLVDRFAYRAEISPEGRILMVNQRLSTLFQRNYEFFIDAHVRDIFGFDFNEPEFKSKWDKLLNGSIIKITNSFEIENKTYWLDQYLAVVYDHEHKPNKILYIALDVTEVKLLEKQLRSQIKEISQETRRLRKEERKLKKEKEAFEQERKKLQFLVDILNQSVGIMVINEQMTIIEINPWLSKILGYLEEEITYNKLSLIVAKPGELELKSIWNRIIRGENVAEIFQFRRKDGNLIELTISFYIYREEKNLLIYAVVTH